MKHVLASLILCLATGSAVSAECVGTNLIEAMSEADQVEIRARTDVIPYHRGLFWQATRDDAQITLIGTYHFDHPGLAVIVEDFAPVIRDAQTLLVEAGPKEEKEIQTTLIQDPSIIMDATGPTLPERMEDADWKRLVTALEVRGIPGVMASRIRPWYAVTVLGISPCMMAQVVKDGGARGLDRQLMDVASSEAVPVQALEPSDTFLKLFGDLSPDEEIEMLIYALPSASYADDYATTLTDAYFDEDVWTIWEFSRVDGYRNSGLPAEKVDEMTDEAQVLLMDERNRSWIAPLTEAAAEAAENDKGVVAAFGALHLPGEEGVLRLLEKDGWTVKRLQ
ncbi:MAG: TraB/GumN family protein [Paracoccus sp. (in: a-proteobacteria)]